MVEEEEKVGEEIRERNSLADAMSALSLTKRKVENHNRKFSDYKVLKIIGTGTFGKVYLATL